MGQTKSLPAGTYSVLTASAEGISVKCPRCGKAATVTADKTRACFRCTSCGHARTRARVEWEGIVENCCDACGRYYRVRVSDSRFSVLRTACPHCGHRMPGRVQKRPAYSYTGEIRQGREPFFGLELWFLADCGGKLVWALNRAHLAWLIDYLSAGLREKPRLPGRTQADHLPAFMKTAKHRGRVVHCLKRMQQL